MVYATELMLVERKRKFLNNALTISASSSSRSSKSSATLRAPPSLPPLLRFKLLAGVVGKPVGAIEKNQALRATAAQSQVKNNEQTACSITKRFLFVGTRGRGS